DRPSPCKLSNEHTPYFYSHAPHPALHSFPTRPLFRSQELCQRDEAPAASFAAVTVSPEPVSAPALPAPLGVIEIELASGSRLRRSEEHTSELQSHLNLVCRLLLENKKAEASEQGRTGC